MADKRTADTPEPMDTIEQHRKTCGTRLSVYAGAMAQAGWSPGKRVTAAEYDKAVQAFLKGGIRHA